MCKWFDFITYTFCGGGSGGGGSGGSGGGGGGGGVCVRACVRACVRVYRSTCVNGLSSLRMPFVFNFFASYNTLCPLH